MIQSNELRIGNIFLEKFSQTEIKVLEISAEKIIFEGDFDNNWQAQPIPLTEEWLLKFGFNWKNHGLRKGNLVIRLCGNVWSIFLSNETNPFDIEIKSVHQLQNLYFALTNQELKPSC